MGSNMSPEETNSTTDPWLERLKWLVCFATVKKKKKYSSSQPNDT